MAAGFAVVAPFMVPILYGGRYAEPALLIGLIGVLQAARFFIVWPTTAALSMGRTRTVMFANLMRLVAYPAAYAGLVLFGGLVGVVTGFTAGELASIYAAVMLVNRDTNRPLFTGFGRLTDLLLTGVAIVLWDLAARAWSLPLVGAAVVTTAILLFRVIRREYSILRETVAQASSAAWRAWLRVARVRTSPKQTERLS